MVGGPPNKVEGFQNGGNTDPVSQMTPAPRVLLGKVVSNEEGSARTAGGKVALYLSHLTS